MSRPHAIRLAILIAIVYVFAPLSTSRADGTLWYNGNYDGRDATANATSSFGYNNGGTLTAYTSQVYDNFIVPAGQTWTITSVYSNNQFFFNNGSGGESLPTTATWQIRSGVSSGVAGTLVASGDTAATVTPGHAQDNVTYFYNEYKVAATVASVTLTAGTYWLTVAPDDPTHYFGNYSGIETTSGANSVGMPMGDDGNSFITNTLPANSGDSLFYTPTNSNSVEGAGTWDYSMGVVGTAVSSVPEPSSWIMLLSGLAGLTFVVRRRIGRRAALA